MYPCRKVIKDRAKRGVTGGLEESALFRSFVVGSMNLRLTVEEVEITVARRAKMKFIVNFSMKN